MEPIIRVENLSYAYPDGNKALEDISFEVQSAEKLALVGANGAGKSTLLLHLNGILQGSEGANCACWIDGLEIKKNNLGKIRGLVGIVFQNPDDQLFSPTVYDDVAYGPLYQGIDRLTVEAKVNQALADVKLQGCATRNPYHLSGGEKKRAAIATVLSMDPKILIFDEPTAGLDPRARRELIGLLKELPQTLLIATHDLDLVSQLATRVIVLRKGKIAADGTCQEILGNEALLYENDLK